jgi:hypothetical protein
LLLVFGSGNPHVFEGGQTGKDATALPAHDVSLSWGKNSRFDFVWQASLELFHESIGEAFEEGVST